MRDDYIADGSTLFVGQGDTQTAGIDGDALVNQEAGQTLRRVGAATGVERAW
jgi:hypothetical protein